MSPLKRLERELNRNHLGDPVTREEIEEALQTHTILAELREAIGWIRENR